MKRRIICIGNRFSPDDTAGPEVYDALRQMHCVPDEIEVIDGGLMGLNLLPLLEQGGRVVFVDAVRGYGPPGEIVLLDRQQIVGSLQNEHFDHQAGVAYLLTVLPRVCDGEMPEEILLVGVEQGHSPESIERAATLSIAVALNGAGDRR